MSQSWQYYNTTSASITDYSKSVMSNLLKTMEAAENKVNLPHINDCVRFFLEYSDEEFAKCLEGSDSKALNPNMVVLTDNDYTMSVEYSEEMSLFKFDVCSNVNDKFNHSIVYTVEALLDTVNEEFDTGKGVGLPPFYMQLIVRIGRWEV